MKAGIIVIIGFCVIILPWTLRNYALYKKFLLISSNGGFIFFMSYHPLSKGEFIPEGTRYTLEQKKALNECSNAVESDRLHYQFAFDFIRKNPKRVFELIFIRLKLLWTKVEYKKTIFEFLPYLRIPLITFHLLSLLALVGLISLWKHLKKFFLPIAYILHHSIIISFFYIYDGPRVRLVMLPILAIFASVGIIGILSSLMGLRLFQIKTSNAK